MAAKEKADVGQTTMSADKLAGHLEGLLKRVRDGSWTERHFQAIQEGRDPFALPTTARVDVNDRVQWWRMHYQRRYRMNPDFSNLYLPEHQPGFDRLVIMAKGLTHRRWVEMAREIHGVNLYNQDLDGCVTTNDRAPENRPYGIWIRDRQESDEELKSLSANDLKRRKVSGITLLERLVAGTGYLFDEQCYMDVKNITLCSGSRYSYGSVPNVGWHVDGRRLCVGWCSADCADDGLRTRAVVS